MLLILEKPSITNRLKLVLKSINWSEKKSLSYGLTDLTIDIQKQTFYNRNEWLSKAWYLWITRRTFDWLVRDGVFACVLDGSPHGILEELEENVVEVGRHVHKADVIVPHLFGDLAWAEVDGPLAVVVGGVHHLRRGEVVLLAEEAGALVGLLHHGRHLTAGVDRPNH